MKKPDCIFVFFGGAMSGVFGAGVVKVLQQMNFYNRIQRIYSVSAGAHNGSYLRTRAQPNAKYLRRGSAADFLFHASGAGDSLQS